MWVVHLLHDTLIIPLVAIRSACVTSAANHFCSTRNKIICLFQPFFSLVRHFQQVLVQFPIHGPTEDSSYFGDWIFFWQSADRRWFYLQHNTKTLFTLLKHSKQDHASVIPLHKHNSVLQDDPMKATILDEQFQSVFSRKSPNSVSSLVTWNYKKVLMQTDPC